MLFDYPPSFWYIHPLLTKGFMPARIYVNGLKYGRLLVLEDLGGNPKQVLCRCDCGNDHFVISVLLRNGSTKSCGCLRRTPPTNKTHGKSNSATYRVWAGMMTRCTNEKEPSWKNYGGRGITVCERWKKFENFLTDMGERPIGLTIDRYPNNDGNYEPGNCRWATYTEQAENRRSARYVVIYGVSMKLSVASARFGISSSRIRDRIDHLGWAPESAVETPVNFYKRNGKAKANQP